MNHVNIVTDLQFGSTGKGLFSGFLARTEMPDTIVTAWAPNAGHSYVDEFGTKFVTCALPSGIFAHKPKRVLLGPGSVISPELLLNELELFSSHMEFVELMIHPHAAVVTEDHRRLERAGSLAKIGSTLKGVSEAMIQKLRRDPHDQNVARVLLEDTPLESYLVSVEEYNQAVDESEVMNVEGAQGYSLSMNHGFYPFTTSRDSTTLQILSDCGLPWNLADIHVYGVCRTFPIRVNNRDGSSGPGYDDQEEIEWNDIGVEPELTTVTKLPRRIFTFSEEQIRMAIRQNGVETVFLNFCNYVKDAEALDKIVNTISKYAPVVWMGWGPQVDQIEPAVGFREGMATVHG